MRTGNDIMAQSINEITSGIPQIRNIGFQRLFGLSNMVIIDNNRSEKELITQTLNTANRMARSLMNKPVSNFTAKQWIKNELEAKKRK